MLSFSLVAEALTGLIYHRPSGENFSFGSLDFLSNVALFEAGEGGEFFHFVFLSMMSLIKMPGLSLRLCNFKFLPLLHLLCKF